MKRVEKRRRLKESEQVQWFRKEKEIKRRERKEGEVKQKKR